MAAIGVIATAVGLGAATLVLITRLRLWPALRIAMIAATVVITGFVLEESLLVLPVLPGIAETAAYETYLLVLTAAFFVVFTLPLEAARVRRTSGDRPAHVIATAASFLLLLGFLYIMFVVVPLSRSVGLCLPPGVFLSGPPAYCNLESRKLAVPLGALLLLISYGATLWHLWRTRMEDPGIRGRGSIAFS